MKRLSTIILIAFTSIQLANAQWTSVATFNQVVSAMQSFNGHLFIGGNFTASAGQNCYWSASWDKVNGLKRQTDLIGGNGIHQFGVFQGDLYATGGMNGYQSIMVGVWDSASNTWNSGESFNYSASGIYGDDNDLYIGGDFGVVTKNGVPFGPKLAGFTKGIGSIIKYNGDIIISGGFDSSGTTILNGIARYSAGSWLPLGTGGAAGTMAVYNNELYVAGRFTTAGGVTVNDIARWNGSTWADVGGGVDIDSGNGIQDMKVINGALYVVGDFSKIGGVNARYAAKWNGSTWSSLGYDQGSSFLTSIEESGGSLFVSDFSFTKSTVYKNDNLNAISTLKGKPAIVLYPSPATDNVNVTLPVANTEVSVYSVLGQLMFSNKETQQQVTLDIKSWPNGVYLLSAKGNEGITEEKFIVQH